MPHARSEGERAPALWAAICCLTLGAATAGAPATRAAEVVLPTVSQQQGNPRLYAVHYDHQKRAYDHVKVSFNENLAQLHTGVEYVINYGGTCDPAYVLDRSAILLSTDNQWQAQIHEYEGEINYSNLVNQHFGSNNTQNFKARDACNAALQQRLAQGQSLAQALKSSFTVWQVPFHSVRHELFCRSLNGNDERSAMVVAPISFDVLCYGTTFPAPHRDDPAPPSPSDAPRPGDLVLPFAVGAVTMAATQPSFQGVCPQEVTFQGTIRVSANGTVKYQFIDSKGPVSPVHTLKFFNDTEKIVTFKQRLPAAGSIGGLAATPGPAPPSGPRLAPNSDPNIHTGWRALRVLSPNRLDSAPAFYKVTCETQPGGGGRLTAPPPIATPPPPSAPGRLAVAKRPDLVILAVQPVPGDDLRLRVVVKNQGDAAAGAFRVKLLYRRDGRVLTTDTATGPLAPNASRTVVVQARSPLANAEALELRADDPSQIVESNEGNNGFEYEQPPAKRRQP